MSLIDWLASVGCLAAALAMLALARDHLTRWAHVVMVAAMVALFGAMDARPVVLGCALTLAITASALLFGRHRERRSCAIDALACAALLGLLAVRTDGSSSGGHAMTMSAGTTMSSGTTMDMSHDVPGSAVDVRLVAAVLIIGLVWAAIAHRAAPRRGVASWGAAAVMVASMSAMTLSLG